MTLRLSLVIDGTAAGAKKAAAETSGALGDVKKAADASGAAIQRAADESVVSLARVRTEAAKQTRGAAGAGGVTFQSLQGGVDASLGIGGAPGANRGADIAAYGRELDRLRARFNPLAAAGQQYKATLADINAAARLGAINERERADAIQRTKDSFAQQVVAMRGGVAATNEAAGGVGKALRGVNDNVAGTSRQARAEMINLSRQMQDVFVGLTTGQAPMMILLQQGPQIADVFATSEKSVGEFFKSAVSGVARFLTPAALVTTAVLGIGIAGVTAASQWGASQRAITAALTGIGQASGVLQSDVNRIAEQSAAGFGLSISEARGFATELVATGKIAKENIAPIVALGHRVAVAYGEDAADAAKRLAQAYTDPAKGAEELNKRLGFLDAASLRQISNLQQQNRLYEAQALLTRGVEQGLQGVERQLSSSTKFWTSLGNGISNAWDAFGRGVSRFTGIGFTQGLDEEIAGVKERIAQWERVLADEREHIEALRKSGATEAQIASVVPSRQGAEDGLKRERAELERLNGEWERYWRGVEAAQTRRDSFAQSAAVDRALPGINQRQQLNNDYLNLSLTLDAVNRTGGAASPILEGMGRSYEQLAKAVQEAKGAVDGFRSTNDKTLASLELQIRSVGVRSPQGLGQIAYDRTLLDRGSTSPNATREAELAQTLAIRSAEQQIVDARNQSLLSAQQRVEAAGAELAALGRSSVEQERQRALLQARHQLEQDALRLYGSRDAYDQNHLAALERQINAEAAIKQTLAEQQALRDVAFERSQLFRSSDEQQVASRLRGIYGDDYQQHENGSIAQGMRDTQRYSMLRDTGVGAFRDIAAAARQNEDRLKAMGDAAVSAFDRATDKLLEFALNEAWNAIFKNAGSLFGGGGGIGMPLSLAAPGGGLSAAGGRGAGDGGGVLSFIGSMLGGLFDEGGYTGNRGVGEIAGVVHGKEYVFDADSTACIGVPTLEALRRNVRGYEAGGFVGAGPPALPSPMRTAAGAGGTGGGWRPLSVKVIHQGEPIDVSQARINDDSGEMELETTTRALVRDELASGSTNGVFRSKYGSSPRLRALR